MRFVDLILWATFTRRLPCRNSAPQPRAEGVLDSPDWSPYLWDMTVRLELNPEVEAGLLAQAEACGLSLEAYVEQVLRERSAATAPAMKGTTEKAQAFVAFARNHRPTPLLSDDAVRRESLIRDVQ
jgi:hypothetical protein